MLLKIVHPKKTLSVNLIRPKDLEIYRARSGIITKKRCSSCKEFLDVSLFHLHGRNLASVCKYCYSTERYPEYYDRRGGRKKLVRNHENITRGENGLEGIICKSCKKWKELQQFYHTETRLRPECRKCISQRVERTRHLRLARKIFGENSQEVMYLENEKGHNRFKAMCKVLGLVRYFNVLTKKREKISSAVLGILPSVPMGAEKFEENIKCALPEVEKGRRRGIDVAMLPV